MDREWCVWGNWTEVHMEADTRVAKNINNILSPLNNLNKHQKTNIAIPN